MNKESNKKANHKTTTKKSKTPAKARKPAKSDALFKDILANELAAQEFLTKVSA